MIFHCKMQKVQMLRDTKLLKLYAYDSNFISGLRMKMFLYIDRMILLSTEMFLLTKIIILNLIFSKAETETSLISLLSIKIYRLLNVTNSRYFDILTEQSSNSNNAAYNNNINKSKESFPLNRT